jgi:hypothetical protein
LRAHVLNAGSSGVRRAPASNAASAVSNSSRWNAAALFGVELRRREQSTLFFERVGARVRVHGAGGGGACCTVPRSQKGAVLRAP